MVGAATGAGAAVQKHGGLAGRIAAALPIDAVAIAGVEIAVGVGFDRWIHGRLLVNGVAGIMRETAAVCSTCKNREAAAG